jgi:hypothetical protein
VAALAGALERPGAGCVLDYGAVAEFFGAQAPAVAYLGALVGYLAAVHLLTYGALLLLARKERR